MWLYKGIYDPCRLQVGPGSILKPCELRNLVFELMGGPGQLEPLPSSVVPLFKDPHLDGILVSLPDCDEWGIRKDWAPPSAFPRLAPQSTPCSSSSPSAAGTKGSKGKPASHQAPPPGRPSLRSGQAGGGTPVLRPEVRRPPPADHAVTFGLWNPRRRMKSLFSGAPGPMLAALLMVRPLLSRAPKVARSELRHRPRGYCLYDHTYEIKSSSPRNWCVMLVARTMCWRFKSCVGERERERDRARSRVVEGNPLVDRLERGK